MSEYSVVDDFGTPIDLELSLSIVELLAVSQQNSFEVSVLL